uniref:ATP synthase subunit a n=1 Tax=Amolops ricketti TaxID=110104 RepID=X2DPX5_AMORI|nr:ATP synthase F0 subunit 6 [Amolops ricketti]AHL84094.1 ATP synthase F0 subunit 6 [Amolops ricketti]
MTMDLFSQFSSPTMLGMPLVLVAMLIPWLLFPMPSKQWANSRISSLQNWFLMLFTKQIFLPMNLPAHKWAFLLTSLMVFLLSMNLLGLFPYTFTPTTQLSINLGLAVPLWLATVLVGFRNQFTHSLAHFLPEGTPTLLIPILILIETISLFIRPLALGVRLTANLTAGHLLIHLISSAVSAIFPLSATASLLTLTILVLLTILEIAVAMIQAYVFILLLSLYLQENT